MNDNYVVVPSQGKTGGFVELARTQKGRLFKKQFLPMNESFTYGGRSIHIDEDFAKTLKSNFKAGVCDIVQVPIVDGANQHVEDPLRNAGEVVDVTYDDTGVYAILDARKYAEDFGVTLLGASALMHLNYEDTKTGIKKGPTLLHLAVTNRPHVTNLREFEEIIAASAGGFNNVADTFGDTPVVLIPAEKTEEVQMDLETLLSTLKTEHDIDVPALQALAEKNSNELVAALSNVVAPNADSNQMTISDVADAVIELAEEKIALSNTIDEQSEMINSLLTKGAEQEIDDLIREGRILPKARERMVALSMSDRALFDDLVPDEPIVAMSAMGVDSFDSPDEAKNYADNIERLANLANGK